MPGHAPRPGRPSAGDQREARQRRGVPEADPGLVKVVVEKDFVGVVAEREEQAIKAAKTLKVTWSDPRGVPSYEELFVDMVSQMGTARLLAQDGDVDKAMASARRRSSRPRTSTRISSTGRWARPAPSRACRATR